MPRSMSTALNTAFSAQDLLPVAFLQAQFRTGTVYLWSGFGTISWNGQTWTGIGDLGSITPIEEGTNVQARGLTIALSGFDATLVSLVMGEVQLGLPVTLYLGAFSGGSIIPTPIAAFAGRIDQPTIEVSGETASISINCESRLIDMNTSVSKRYTDDQQQTDFPGDTAFSFVMGIINATIYWGNNPNSPNNI